MVYLRRTGSNLGARGYPGSDKRQIGLAINIAMPFKLMYTVLEYGSINA
jgi:hypothetical protein